MDKTKRESKAEAENEQLLARGEVSDLLNLEEGLGGWEMKFLESVAKWRGDFTTKQVITIHKLWDRVLGKGKQ